LAQTLNTLGGMRGAEESPAPGRTRATGEASFGAGERGRTDGLQLGWQSVAMTPSSVAGLASGDWERTLHVLAHHRASSDDGAEALAEGGHSGIVDRLMAEEAGLSELLAG
jgi:hypothetical protein